MSCGKVHFVDSVTVHTQILQTYLHTSPFTVDNNSKLWPYFSAWSWGTERCWWKPRRRPVSAWVSATISTKIWTLLFKPFLVLFSAQFFSCGCKSIEYLSRNRWSFFSRYSSPFNLGLWKGGGVLGKFYLLSRYVLLSMLTFNMTVFLRRPIFETPL